ncbi:MAG: GNAT family N-acetyltransferase [Anaerolineae bacterium]|nr:GNAT family N-acetyltransferase [Anaerolineae bacterium]
MSELVYCPICGHNLAWREEGGRLRQTCDNCGYIHYVNPVPAVGILIEYEDGIVLIKRRNPPHKDEWTLPSGFIEADESAEDAAIREAKEETGLDVEILDLAGINSFPEGPPMSGIIIFYRTRPVGGALCAGDDASEARVFSFGDIPLSPFRTHREAIAQYLHERKRDSGLYAQPDSAHEDEGRDFLIRPAESTDAQELLAMLQLIPANRDLSREQWRDVALRFREANGVEVFVAQSNQQPPILIGFIALSIMRGLTEGRGFINDVAVLPTHQRRGVGAALLEAALKRAARLNLNHVMVNTDRANERAQAFYAALGFAESSVLHLKLRQG